MQLIDVCDGVVLGGDSGVAVVGCSGGFAVVAGGGN